MSIVNLVEECPRRSAIFFGLNALVDEEGGVGVPEIVDPKLRKPIGFANSLRASQDVAHFQRWPDTGPLPDHDVADDLSAGVDVSGWGNPGECAAIGTTRQCPVNDDAGTAGQPSAVSVDQFPPPARIWAAVISLIVRRYSRICPMSKPLLSRNAISHRL